MEGTITRRRFLATPLVAAAISRPQAAVIVPVHIVLDRSAQWGRNMLPRFWQQLWPQAVRDFARCGIRLEITVKTGDIWRPPNREPAIIGLDSGVINLVVTDRIPIEWDNGRLLSGVTTLYRGHVLSMVGLNRAHGHQIPFLSVNTCVHELLHVLLQDVFQNRPEGLWGEAREYRVDWYATRMWLFHDGAAVRNSAQQCLARIARSDNLRARN
jgi:hypothetical protein